uniref:TTKRSYEDQ domain-containing protein n=1 Tax=Rhabditophanes sp. KR3021 TaxID=114890 RepID=A0AC35TMX2_9BILA
MVSPTNDSTSLPSRQAEQQKSFANQKSMKELEEQVRALHLDNVQKDEQLECVIYRNEVLSKTNQKLRGDLNEVMSIADEKKSKIRFNFFGSKPKTIKTEEQETSENILLSEISFRVTQNEILQRKIDMLEHEIQSNNIVLDGKITKLEKNQLIVEKETTELRNQNKKLLEKVKILECPSTQEKDYRESPKVEQVPNNEQLTIIVNAPLEDISTSLQSKVAHGTSLSTDSAKILELVRNISEMYQHFFHLINERTLIYPCDATLQEVKPSIKKLKEISAEIESVFESWNSSTQYTDDIDNLRDIYSPLWFKISELFENAKPIFESAILEENREAYCTPNLQRHNELYMEKIFELLNLPQMTALTTFEDCSQSITFIDDLTVITKNISDQFVSKIFIENRLSTVGPKLKALNDDLSRILLGTNDFLCKLKVAILYKNQEPGSVISPVIHLDNSMSLNIEDSLFNESEETSDMIVNLKATMLKLQAENETLHKGLNVENDSNDIKQIESVYVQKYKSLVKQTEYAKSCTCFFKKRLENMINSKKELIKNIADAKKQIYSLNDDLETTKQNYEEQMKMMFLHIDELNIRINEQASVISALSTNQNL